MPPSSSASASPFPEEESTATPNPCSASLRAAAAPMPLPPAVTIATFPAMSPSSRLFQDATLKTWRFRCTRLAGVPCVDCFQPSSPKALWRNGPRVIPARTRLCGRPAWL